MRSLAALVLLFACNPDESTTDSHTHTHTHDEATAFSLAFTATAGGAAASCDAPVGGLGPTGAHTIGLSDLRFYVSNVVFRDADGNEVHTTFDENEFQYTGDSGWVGLIDLTSNASGDCADGAIAFSEGTARTHTALTGTTHVEDVVSVSFDVGVPQALMQEVIATNSAEGAPSPLGEMYWSWAMGYRHFVLNMTVDDGVESGEGYIHLGSTGCGAMGELALESKDACDKLNTPQVELAGFDLSSDVVTVDLAALLAGVDFVSPVYDPVTFEVIGDATGAECHSGPTQPDCAVVFGNVGLNLDTGAADASANLVFGAAAR